MTDPATDAENGREPSAELTALLERHGVGSAVAVFHSPVDPREAVLIDSAQ